MDQDPGEGAFFVDAQGCHWQVQGIVKSPNVPDFYLVKLAFGARSNQLDHHRVLGKPEFLALVAERNLQPVGGSG